MCAARRLFHREHKDKREHDARDARGHEHLAPSVQLADPPEDGKEGDEGERIRRSQDRERQGSAGPAKQVRQHRVRRRETTGLACTHEEAGRRQLPDVRDQAGERGHHAPEGEPDRDDVAAVPAIREPRDRQTEERIEGGKRQAGHEAERRVGDVHFRLDEGKREAEDRSVEIVEGGNQAEKGERVDGARIPVGVAGSSVGAPAVGLSLRPERQVWLSCMERRLSSRSDRPLADHGRAYQVTPLALVSREYPDATGSDCPRRQAYSGATGCDTGIAPAAAGSAGS